MVVIALAERKSEEVQKLEDRRWVLQQRLDEIGTNDIGRYYEKGNVQEVK